MLSMLLVLSLSLGLMTGLVSADEKLEFQAVWSSGDASLENARSNVKTIGGVNYLFLSASEEPTAAHIYFRLSDASAMTAVRGAVSACGIGSGEPVDLKEICGEGDTYPITLLAQSSDQTCEYAVTVVPTTGVASLYLVSDDPVNKGRAWVESSPTKSNKATGAMVLVNPDGSVVHEGKLKQIKGRGNSTWQNDKKPYQIKLEQKADLLETGEKANASKTWVLLTNATDPTMLRNNIVYDLSVALGMMGAIQCRPVSLFYDGEYRGAYLLCEKVEIGKGRVNITDMEDLNEEANPGVDLESLPIEKGTTENGATYTYCKGMNSPSDITGGYLLEMDSAVRAQAELCYITTSRNNYVVVKSPECASKEEMDYIASYYQDFEDAVYAQGVNNRTGKKTSDYADIESFATNYLVNELTKNPDGFRTSNFMYKDKGEDAKLVANPVWDYDLSFGTSWGPYVDNCAQPDGFFTLYGNFAQAMYNDGAFRQSVHDVYLGRISPLVKAMLSGESVDPAMSAFEAYRQELSASARANSIVWGAVDWDGNVNALRSYITTRDAWLTENYASWNKDSKEDLIVFYDVPQNVWYYESVMSAARYGLLQGFGFGIFEPLGNTTRAQTAQVLMRLSGDERVAYSRVFSDVDNGEWFAPAVMWAYKKNVVNGYDDGTFRPNEPITRQDVVVLLYRYLGSPAVQGASNLGRMKDSWSVSNYARNAVEWSIENKVIVGYEDGTFRPFNNITRAELAAIITRFYEAFIADRE